MELTEAHRRNRIHSTAAHEHAGSTDDMAGTAPMCGSAARGSDAVTQVRPILSSRLVAVALTLPGFG